MFRSALVAACLAVGLTSMSWAALSFVEPAPLNTNAHLDSRPDKAHQVSADGLGNWLAVWQSSENLDGAGSDMDIFISRSTDAGATWASPEALNSRATTDSGHDFSPHLANDGAGNWVVVWHSKDATEGEESDMDIFVMSSANSGETWSEQTLLNNFGYTDTGDDSMARVTTDAQGNWLAVWQSSEDVNGVGDDLDILFARSTDAGATWASPEAINTNAVTDSMVNLDHDTLAQVAVDDSGNWLVIWESNTDYNRSGRDIDILFSRSIDLGATWSAPDFLNTSALFDTRNDPAPKIATDGQGQWVAVWSTTQPLAGTGADGDIFFTRSADAGATWASPEALNGYATTDLAWDATPDVTADGLGNWLAVWQSFENLNGSGNDVDIFISRSTDAGATWASPEVLSSMATSEMGYDVFPHLTTDGLGNWVAAWESNSDLGGVGTDNDIFFTSASDLGLPLFQGILLTLERRKSFHTAHLGR